MADAARAEHPCHQLREGGERHLRDGIVIPAGRARVEQSIEVIALDPRQGNVRLGREGWLDRRRRQPVLAQQPFIGVDVGLGHALRPVDTFPARRHVRHRRGWMPTLLAKGRICA